MFTGLVQGVGRIVRVERLEPMGGGRGVRIRVDAGDVAGFATQPGDSIALNGACMTAAAVRLHEPAHHLVSARLARRRFKNGKRRLT